MRKKVEVTCFTCEKTFLKDESEVKRSIQRNRRHFCSRVCCGKSNTERIKSYPKTSDISKHAANRNDKYTGLRDFVRRSKTRKCESSITIEELYDLWNQQNGICPYTGIKLEKPRGKVQHCPIKTASLDRIDSSKGYIKGNLQFISTAVNYMKSDMSHEQTIELCKIISKHWK